MNQRKSVSNISSNETSQPESAHQQFLDFVNLFPPKARTLPVQADLSAALADSMIPQRWRDIASGYFVQTLSGLKPIEYPPKGVARDPYDPEPAFQNFLNVHFPVNEYERFRRYLANGDPRFPLATPIERWNWIASLSEMLRVWAVAHREAPMPSPLSEARGWKPDSVCVVCGNLFPLTRKDRSCCGDSCARIHRTRQWRKRKESGATNRYKVARAKKEGKQGAAKKQQRAKSRERKTR